MTGRAVNPQIETPQGVTRTASHPSLVSATGEPRAPESQEVSTPGEGDAIVPQESSPEAPAPAPSVAGALRKLYQAVRDLERHEQAYYDISQQFQSLGAAEDLKANPLMPVWNTSNGQQEMIQVGIDFRWIPEEELEYILKSWLNALGRQVHDAINEVHTISGEILTCLKQLNPEHRES